MIVERKPFVKITFEDLKLAKEFFDNKKHYAEWIYAVTEYYQGNEIEIKTKIVSKYFNNYKKTMDFIIKSKEFGKKGKDKATENKEVNTETLTGVLELPLEEPLQLNSNNKDISSNNKEETKPPAPKGEMIDFDILLETLNKIFGKEFRVVNKTVREKYKALLKQGYTKANIHTAMLNCKNDEFHKKNNWKYCNIAYFARPNTIDLHGTQIIPEQKGIIGTFKIHDHD